MAVDFERFLAWAESRFGDVIISGPEIKVNSIFTDDYKHHMWCSPRGGKDERPDGVYHCWKTERKGTLVRLVMDVDGCTYEEAQDQLGGGGVSWSELEAELDKLFAKPSIVVKKDKPKLSLPPCSYLIDTLEQPHQHIATSYLQERGLSIDGYYYCTAGDYKQRIIIPYYDAQGDLIFFNARYVGKKQVDEKYKGPSKECGIGKGDVLYFKYWPGKNRTVFLTEGEFDASVLVMAGLDAGAFGGKSLTSKQLEILRSHEYLPILCLDNDKAGGDALPAIASTLRSNGFSVSYARPPVSYKDWNELYLAVGLEVLREYILKVVRSYKFGDDLNLLMR